MALQNLFVVDASVTAKHNADWIGITSAPTTDSEEEAKRSQAVKHIQDLLSCEHLVVLTGLGTSLCIKKPKDTVNESRNRLPTMSDLLARVRSDTNAAAVIDSLSLPKDQAGNLELILSKLHMKKELDSLDDQHEVSSAISYAEETIKAACSPKLPPLPYHQVFLRNLTHRPPRKPRVNLFTTNYDLCFESAAKGISLPIIDGFSFTNPPTFQPTVFDYDIVTTSNYGTEPDYCPRLLRLYKLHGSVNWDRRNNGEVIRADHPKNPVLIYPQAGKYAASYDQPYLEMISRFQNLLRQRNLGILIIGSGLNDKHLSTPILAAVKSNPSLRLVLASFDIATKKPEKQHPAGQILSLARSGDPRITIFSCDLPKFSALMPSTSMLTSTELHERRIKKLEKSVSDIQSGAGGNP